MYKPATVAPTPNSNSKTRQSSGFSHNAKPSYEKKGSFNHSNYSNHTGRPTTQQISTRNSTERMLHS